MRAQGTPASARMRVALRALERAQRAVRRDHGAAHPAVAHQKIAAEAEPQQRHFRRQLAHERGQRSMMSRGVKNKSAAPPACQEVCFAIDTSRSTAGAEFRRQIPRRSLRAHARCAPAAKRLFKSERDGADVAGAHRQHHDRRHAAPRARIRPSSSTLSTKIGSTTPRLRTARQIARPSAPAIGASPGGIDLGDQQHVAFAQACGRSHPTDRGCGCSDAAETPAPAAAPASAWRTASSVAATSVG